MQERQYQAKLIKKLEKMFSGCMILKNDPTYLQGVPDILILHGDRWAMLEIKIAAHANIQPNQEYYIDRLGQMSYASFINPENEGEVLHELQLALGSGR